MKNGTQYALAFKKVFSKLKQSAERPEPPPADDPVRRLAVSILGREAGDEAGERALERIFGTMLDWNELRVSSAEEVERAMGNAVPNAQERARELLRALHAVYYKENKVSLDRLKALGRREAKQYLEALDGVDPYAAASVVLWSLGGHAIPVDDRVWNALREAGVVHPEADRAEVQAFLERHISASDAKQSCVILRLMGKGGLPASRKPARKRQEASHKRRVAKK
jgi:endonuclease III